MNLLRSFILLSFAIPLASYAGTHRDIEGGHVGGGDAIFCDPGADFPSLIGLYSLEYAAAIGKGMHSDDFTPVNSWQESSERISKILERISPALKSDFDDFSANTSQIGNPNPISTSVKISELRWWSDKDGENDMIPYDPKRGDLSNLPISCHASVISGPLGMDQMALIRIVERTSTTYANGLVTNIRYGYDLKRLVPMFSQNPLSASFFMVHEWLWDLTDDIKVSRAVNIFLHSKQVENMSDIEIQFTLRLMGLQF